MNVYAVSMCSRLTSVLGSVISLQPTAPGMNNGVVKEIHVANSQPQTWVGHINNCLVPTSERREGPGAVQVHVVNFFPVIL